MRSGRKELPLTGDRGDMMNERRDPNLSTGLPAAAADSFGPGNKGDCPECHELKPQVVVS